MTGDVRAHGRSWHGACELDVEIDGHVVKAMSYPFLTGTPEIGERVVVSADGVQLGLGTGGYVFVVSREHPASTPPSGHLMKARYTPMQVAIQGVDEQGTEHYSVMESADSIESMPVVTADLHSSLPAIIHGIRAIKPESRIAYIHTDTAALPVWFSALAARLRAAGEIDAIITAGQSFGGDLEAVNIYTALLAARHVVHADVAIVIHGPGNVGTGSIWGFSGTACGEVINAVNTLEGRAIGTLRVSMSDPRERHVGLSHHSLTAYLRVAKTPALIPVAKNDAEVYDKVMAHADRFIQAGHTVCEVDVAPAMEAMASDSSLRSMGRTYSEDPSPFLFAAAAGLVSVRDLPPSASQ